MTEKDGAQAAGVPAENRCAVMHHHAATLHQRASNTYYG